MKNTNKTEEESVGKEPVHINDALRNAIEELQCVANRKDGIRGINSGFRDIDKLTSGWQNGNLIVIGGGPAIGKTSFILSLIINMAVKNMTPIPTALFSLEMNCTQLLNCFVANICDISLRELRSGRLESHQWEHLDTKIKDLYDKPIFIDDTPGLSVSELCNKVHRLVHDYGIKCLVVDYLQLINAKGMTFSNREQEISLIVRSLKNLAKKLNISVILVSQLSRAQESRQGAEGKRPQLADLRDSGAIEQDADVVCFVHRPEYYKITEDERGNSLIGLADIIIAKQRCGDIGEVRLKFIKETMKFMNLDDKISPPSDLNWNSNMMPY